MVGQLEMEKRNLESSLLFMQQEHSNTLKALHEEISGLQKKCTELTFQLTMHDVDGDEDNKEEYEKKLNELKENLRQSDLKHAELEKEVKKKDRIIKELNSQLKRNERKYLEELKSKNSQVLALKVELDGKSGSIANLTTEIHRLKVLHTSSNTQLQPPRTPPSREKSSKWRAARQTSASAADILSRPVTAKSSMPAPDAELFIARASPVEPDTDVGLKPMPPVLPPISGDIKTVNRRQQLIRRRIDLKSQPEYTKLAVDQLASSSNTYIHEPNTTK